MTVKRMICEIDTEKLGRNMFWTPVADAPSVDYIKNLEEQNVRLWKENEELEMKIAMMMTPDFIEQKAKRELRPEVYEFAFAMEKKLRENDNKGGWKNCSWSYLQHRLNEELKELDFEVAFGTPLSTLLEAADVANFLMMMVDKKKGEKNE